MTLCFIFINLDIFTDLAIWPASDISDFSDICLVGREGCQKCQKSEVKYTLSNTIFFFHPYTYSYITVTLRMNVPFATSFIISVPTYLILPLTLLTSLTPYSHNPYQVFALSDTPDISDTLELQAFDGFHRN